MTKKGEEKFHRRRLRGSYVSVIISVSLVLFILGLFGLLVLYIQERSNEVKENIGFTIYLHDEVGETDISRLKKAVELSPYTRTIEYISKEQAVEIMKKDLGEDFMNYLDYNPLLACLVVKVTPEYAHSDSLAAIKQQLMRSSKIKEIDYEAPLIEKVQAKLRTIGMITLSFAALLLIVSIALINNSIRLAIYSRRFIIKSMQLVGATQPFIRKPFVQRGIMHGIYSAIIAMILTLAVIYYGQQYLPDFIQFQQLEILASLFGLMLLLGVIISWVSTSLAVRKFLRTRSNKLY